MQNNSIIIIICMLLAEPIARPLPPAGRRYGLFLVDFGSHNNNSLLGMCLMIDCIVLLVVGFDLNLGGHLEAKKANSFSF
mmetsp:Transcript_24107/g.37170  ORF Transcript_24107/g.37170 Transcript_24107/m.37170 type:complete len:80 (+) Transcript_24107:660-899(+)